MTEQIPSPPGWPVVGNVTDIDAEFPLGSLVHLADLYGTFPRFLTISSTKILIGPIYRLTTAGISRTFIGSQELMNEICDEKRFTKIVAGPLKEVRNGTHDGLFTAHPGENNWEVAHRILIPAFGPLSIRSMYGGMHDIATQLVMKWARRGPDYVIPVTDDFTRLTLDTIALCAMDYRFNSYYQNEMHPFVDAMASFLQESGARSVRLAVVKPFFRQQESDYHANIELMRKTGLEVIEARRKHPNDKKDLLNAMLTGRDAKTGQGMTDESIIDNMITFLIAGHETTRYCTLPHDWQSDG